VQALKDLRSGKKEITATLPDGTKKKVGISQQTLTYSLRPRELFARAYAQYIAEKTQDPRLLPELEEEQKGKYPNQWSTEDFALIKEAFDNLFRKRGWAVDH